MKIGSIELSISTVVYASILIALALFLPILGLSRYGAMRDSWHRGTVVNATVQGGDSVDTGIAACQKLISTNPGSPAPRLYLACLLANLKKYSEAKEAFLAVENADKATAEDKSLALVGAGCVICLDGSKDGKPANIAEAEKLFQKAIDYQATPDALAAMALLKSWKSGPLNPEVESLVVKALGVSPAPPPGLSEQLYRLHASILAQHHKAADATAAYRAVKAINPANTQMEDSVRDSMLQALNQPGLDAATRRAEIDRVSQEVERFGKSKVDAQIAIGLAWTAFRNDANYMGPSGAFDKARQMFRQATEVKPKDPRGHRNLAALYEDRVVAIGKELTVPIPGFTGEAPQSSAWSAPLVPERNKPGVNDLYPKADQDRITKIRTLLVEEEAILKRFLDIGDPSLQDKIDAKTRMLSSVRRQYWLANPEQQATMRQFLIKRALDMATELAALDESGRSHYSLGLVLIEKGDLAAARGALLEASKRGYKQPELTQLLTSLDAKTRIVSSGPSSRERRFGSAPLVHATFDTPLGPSALQGVTVTMDGKRLDAQVYGSQILFVANSDADLAGGAHTIHVAAGDPKGPPIDFPDFKFLIDKEPPEWTLEPAPGGIKNDAVINIGLKDASGIDWGTLSAGLRSEKAVGAQPFDVVLIRDGHYSKLLSRINAKVGDAVNKSPVSLTAPNTIPDGALKVWIEVKDLSGNKLKAEKSYTVK